MQRLVSTYALWRQIHNHFPKKSKYTLGRKIDEMFIESFELIFVAGYLSKDKKLPFIQKAIGKIDLLKLFLRIAWEVKDLDTKKYVSLSQPLDEISRMLNGWTRNVESRMSSAPA